MDELMKQLKHDNHIQEMNIETIGKEKEDLKRELKSIKDHHNTEKDRLYGELLTIRKKTDILESDRARLEKTHAKILSERSQLESQTHHAVEDARKYREQVEDLLQINATLKSRVEELHRAHTAIQSQIEDHAASGTALELEACHARIAELTAERTQLLCDAQQADTLAKQEEHLRSRVAGDCAELVKANVTLRQELEDVQRRLREELERREAGIRRRQEKATAVEEARDELGRLKDEMAMLRISADNRSRKIADLTAHIKSMENAMNLAMETRSVLEDKLTEMEARVNSQEKELIQLSQDKGLLIDDVAELRNSAELRNMKIAAIRRENQDLMVQVEKFTREMAARKEFSNLVTEIESSGENYLQLMQNMRQYLHQPSSNNRRGQGHPHDQHRNGGGMAQSSGASGSGASGYDYADSERSYTESENDHHHRGGHGGHRGQHSREESDIADGIPVHP
ncbi:hypothetical protein HK101_005925, partial [Irineochytrium annulatum]